MLHCQASASRHARDSNLHPTAPPAQESEECAAAVGPHARFQLVPGADHNFSGREAGEALAAAVTAFVLEA